MFFEGWENLGRIVLVGTLAYGALLVLLRASGKRTISKMNAFDFVVTVALGSTLATVLLSKSTPLADGVTALALLVFLQFAITWMSVRSKTVSRLIKAEPRLLYHQGEFLRAAMRRERVNEEEVLQAMRQQGIALPSPTHAVILETDGSLTVVSGARETNAGTLANVREGD